MEDRCSSPLVCGFLLCKKDRTALFTDEHYERVVYKTILSVVFVSVVITGVKVYLKTFFLGTGFTLKICAVFRKYMTLGKGTIAFHKFFTGENGNAQGAGLKGKFLEEEFFGTGRGRDDNGDERRNPGVERGGLEFLR